MKKLLKWIVILGLIGGAGYGGYRYALTKQPHEKKDEEKITGKVHKGDLTTVISQVGRLEPVQTIEIKPDQNGKIKKILVKEGMEIAPGQVLSELEIEKSSLQQFAQLQGTLIDTDQAVKDCKYKLEIGKKGSIAGITTREAVKDLEVALLRAQQAFDSAKKQFDVAKKGTAYEKWSVEKVLRGDAPRSQSEIFYLRAPDRGTVMQLLMREGESAVSAAGAFGGGTTIMKIADLDHLEVEANINEIDVANLFEGMNVTITFDAAADKTFHGKLASIAAQGTNINGLIYFPVKVLLQEKDRRLRPEMTARLEIPVPLKKGVTYINKEFIFYAPRKPEPRVLVAAGKDKDGKDKTDERPLKLGLSSDLNIEVTSGVKAGETLVQKVEETAKPFDRK